MVIRVICKSNDCIEVMIEMCLIEAISQKKSPEVAQRIFNIGAE